MREKKGGIEEGREKGRFFKQTKMVAERKKSQKYMQLDR